MKPENIPEALNLIADELDAQRHSLSQLASAASVAELSGKMDRIHNLLVDVLRGDESRQNAFDQARRADNERFRRIEDKVERLGKLRLAPNGAG